VCGSMVASWGMHSQCSMKCMCGGEKSCWSSQCGSSTGVGH
jgi:hypothetical protein